MATVNQQQPRKKYMSRDTRTVLVRRAIEKGVPLEEIRLDPSNTEVIIAAALRQIDERAMIKEGFKRCQCGAKALLNPSTKLCQSCLLRTTIRRRNPK